MLLQIRGKNLCDLACACEGCAKSALLCSATGTKEGVVSFGGILGVIAGVISFFWKGARAAGGGWSGT